jgi:hypothetical protein
VEEVAALPHFHLLEILRRDERDAEADALALA